MAILSASERKLAIVASNVANVSTAGYKRKTSFSKLVGGGTGPAPESVQIGSISDFAQGKISASASTLDLAISGDGFFELRAGDSFVYSRQGQFRLAADGTLVTPGGHVLQQQGGGDLAVMNAAVTILEDGTVLDEGRPVAKIAFDAPDRPENMIPIGESAFAIGSASMRPSEAIVRQGMIENSNVALGDEMVTMTAVTREAETGARLVQVYDDLIGRAISTLGQAR